MKSRFKSACNWRAHMKEFMNADEAKELRLDRTIWWSVISAYPAPGGIKAWAYVRKLDIFYQIFNTNHIVQRFCITSFRILPSSVVDATRRRNWFYVNIPSPRRTGARKKAILAGSRLLAHLASCCMPPAPWPMGSLWERKPNYHSSKFE